MLNVFESVQNNLCGEYYKTPHINSISYILTITYAILLYFSSYKKQC